METDSDKTLVKEIEESERNTPTSYHTFGGTFYVDANDTIQGGRYDGAKIHKIVTLEPVDAMDIQKYLENGKRCEMLTLMYRKGKTVRRERTLDRGLDLVVLFEHSINREMGFHSPTI